MARSRAVALLRNRRFTDSPLERGGFELLVPRQIGNRRSQPGAGSPSTGWRAYPRKWRCYGAKSGHRQTICRGLRVVLAASEAGALNSLIRPPEHRRYESIGGADGLWVRPLFDHPHRQPAAAG